MKATSSQFTNIKPDSFLQLQSGVKDLPPFFRNDLPDFLTNEVAMSDPNRGDFVRHYGNVFGQQQ